MYKKHDTKTLIDKMLNDLGKKRVNFGSNGSQDT